MLVVCVCLSSGFCPAMSLLSATQDRHPCYNLFTVQYTPPPTAAMVSRANKSSPIERSGVLYTSSSCAALQALL